jgi:predicted nucleic acid-binding protein
MKLCLLDTGPIVAFLDSRDTEHARVVRALETFSGRLVTTSAVIVEAMHFLSHIPSGTRLLVEFLLASQCEIHECTSPDILLDAVGLMEKYNDVPMDFADATLVLLGERFQIYGIYTLDRRGFRTYRASRRKAFQLMLGE